MAEDRIFTSKDVDGGEVELKYIKPSQRIISKGDFVYREHFGKSVRAGLLTNAEASKLIKDRNVWGEQREEEAIQLQVQINDLEDNLREIGPSAEGLPLYRDLKALRLEIKELTNIRRSIMENTAESVAAEIRTQFYASECVVYNKNGKRVFKSLEDFFSKLGDDITLDCYRQALITSYEAAFGIDFSKASADTRDTEDRWFDELSAEVAKEDEDEEEEKTTIAEQEEVVEDPKPKPKRRARKKKTATVE